MRLVVSGSRKGRADLVTHLDAFVADMGVPELVILGDAAGVDHDALLWCRARGYNFKVLRVNPRRAIPERFHERNQRMVDNAGVGDFCLGFPMGKGAGTLDCCARARTAGLKVCTIWPSVAQLSFDYARPWLS